MQGINIKATEYFEAVARLGTVARAAEELCVSPSAISQQIRVLEAQLGVMLFRREKRRLILTTDGDRLFEATTQAFQALRNVRSAIARQRDHNSMTVRVSPSFGVRWLGPRIASFAAANPGWDIRVDATPAFSAFDTENVDFDLRYGLGPWAGLTEICVMRDLVLPLCSPGYLARCPTEGALDARLRAGPLIDSVKALCRWDVWLAANRLQIDGLTYPFRFDRSSMSIEMARQGGGVALDSAMLCLGELERGDLVPFAPEIPAYQFEAYWFVCPPRHMNRRIVKRFADWVTQTASEHEARVTAAITQCGVRIQPVNGTALLLGTAG